MLDQISALTPSQFENLAFDLVKALGLRNVTWRTPGADGGRDIEGVSYVRDLTGQDLFQKWYVECKLYSSSLSWPTVWEKISHADVNGADVLLVCTNSNPSPTCETSVKTWNSERRRPLIRFLRGYDIPALIKSFPTIGVSHGLLTTDRDIDAAALPIALIISGTAQAAYASSAFGYSPEAALEAAAALTELLAGGLQSYKKLAEYKPSIGTSTLSLHWLEETGSLELWDTSALRAIVSFVRYVTFPKNLNLAVDKSKAILTLEDKVRDIGGKAEADLDVIANWTKLRVEYSLDKGTVKFYRSVM